MVTQKMLSVTEKRAINKAAARAIKFLTGKKLSKEKKEQIYSVVEGLKAQRRPVVGKEAIALWAAKIDWAIVNGDNPAVGKLLKTPAGPEALQEAETEWYDSNGNCGCGGGGGPSGW